MEVEEHQRVRFDPDPDLTASQDFGGQQDLPADTYRAATRNHPVDLDCGAVLDRWQRVIPFFRASRSICRHAMRAREASDWVPYLECLGSPAGSQPFSLLAFVALASADTQQLRVTTRPPSPVCWRRSRWVLRSPLDCLHGGIPGRRLSRAMSIDSHQAMRLGYGMVLSVHARSNRV